MKKLTVLALSILSILTLTSCATVIKETYSPSGGKAYTADCSDNDMITSTIGECFKAAGDKCGNRGYTALHISDEPVGSIHNTYRLRSLLFSCKK